MSTTGTRVPKAKNVMYTQDYDHAPFADIADLEQRVIGLNPKRYAIAFHDRDVDDSGNPVREHWHTMMSFPNARSLSALANGLGESSSQFLEAWRGDSRNGYAYLAHRTSNARHKFQYDPATIVANFDYPAELAAMESGAAAGRTTAKTDVLLDMLYDGHLTLDELKGQLSGAQIGAYTRKIQDVWNARLEREAKEWRSMMREQKRRSETIWLMGSTETGKTSMARELCAKRADATGYYMSGSTRDLFQNYAGEHQIILDELSPGVLDYADLKRITDPLAVMDNLQAPARYKDKALMPELIVITSAYDPYALYCDQVHRQGIDSFNQLLRRIGVVLELTQDEIRPMEFDPATKMFISVPNQSIPNPYSRKARGAVATVNPLDVFGALTEELELTT